MSLSKLVRFFPCKAVALCLATLAAGSIARADVVLNNLTTAAANGATNGTTVGSALVTGNTRLLLTTVVFPQLNGTTDAFVAGETFTIYSRNANGTVGTALFSNFTVTDSGTGNTGQTEADANVPFTLQPNTGYFFSVNAPTTTGWTYSTSGVYNSMDGVTFPVDNVAYKVVNGVTTYFSFGDGPQLIYVLANPVAAPEPSSCCLLAVAGVGVFLFVRRARKARAA